ncbi:phage tail protein [Serratia rhizosphaerae]
MSQIDSLTAFITANMPRRAMQAFSSNIEAMKTLPACKEMGLDQVQLSIIRYDAVLIWERFPYRECDPRLLMALLDVWLASEDRELFAQVGITNAEPDWDIDPIDEETAIVALTVPMAEALVIVPDDAGAIPYQGKKYRLADAEIWTALSAVIHGPADGAVEVPL